MGISYTVLPLDAEIAAYLRQHRIAVPATRGRYPTPREIRDALAAMPGWFVQYASGPGWWQAIVTDVPLREQAEQYATINGLSFSGDEDEPLHVYFEKGSSLLNLRILERLTHRCGPLVMAADVSPVPVLVTPGADNDWLHAHWMQEIDEFEKRMQNHIRPQRRRPATGAVRRIHASNGWLALIVITVSPSCIVIKGTRVL